MATNDANLSWGPDPATPDPHAVPWDWSCAEPRCARCAAAPSGVPIVALTRRWAPPRPPTAGGRGFLLIMQSLAVTLPPPQAPASPQVLRVLQITPLRHGHVSGTSMTDHEAGGLPHGRAGVSTGTSTGTCRYLYITSLPFRCKLHHLCT